MKKTRTETDSIGKIEVPSDMYYGAQTERSLHHFAIGKDLMPIEIIHALALVKKAAAFVNCDLKKLTSEQRDLIVKAADEVIQGKFDGHFPLRVWQTGSGTQTNMNVNEVIANRAIELSGGKLGSKTPIHPNDHVNLSQSTNDAFPTAMHIAILTRVSEELLPNLRKLLKGLQKKEKEFKGIVKIGRTHLQDATPLTLAQEFSGYVCLLERGIARIETAINGLYDLAIGGTAVGTGMNSHPKFGEKMAEKLQELTKFPFRSHPNKFAALSAHDEIVFFSGALKTMACSLFKIATDIQWMGSGPRCGLHELFLPENEPGSSIMPGKVNPTQCEALLMISAQIFGNDAVIAFAGSQGNFELNVFKPVLAFNALQAIRLMKDAVLMFEIHCIEKLKANLTRIEKYVEHSLMLITALAPKLGYDLCAKIAHKAVKENLSLKEACLQMKALSAKEFDALVVPEKMTHS